MELSSESRGEIKAQRHSRGLLLLLSQRAPWFHWGSPLALQLVTDPHPGRPCGGLRWQWTRVRRAGVALSGVSVGWRGESERPALTP